MMVEDRAGRGSAALARRGQCRDGAGARRSPEMTNVFSLFEVSTPQLYLDIDRTKAQMLGVNVTDVFAALQIYIGSLYVNDFNLFGRTFRVDRAGRRKFRHTPKDVLNLRVRNSTGGTVPLASFTTVRTSPGRTACRATTSIRPPRSTAWRRPATRRPRRSPRWKRSPTRFCPMASATNGPRSPSSSCAPAARRCSPSAWRWCSSSWCWRRSSRA